MLTFISSYSAILRLSSQAHLYTVTERFQNIVYAHCPAPFTRATMSKQHSTLLPKTATMSNEFIVKFCPFYKVECCFDTVAGVDGA